MILKKYNEFKSLNESKGKLWVIDGSFKVTKEMVKNDMFISDLIPDKVYGNFNCSGLGLDTLEGGPEFVQHVYYCYDNNLTNLNEIGNVTDIQAYNNNLTSLEGTNLYVAFLNVQNNNLTDLKGGPNEIGTLFIEENNLISLEGNTMQIGKINTDSNFDRYNIELDFIESSYFIKDDDYHVELLRYCLAENISLNKISNWPESFLDSNIGRSVKSITKYNL